MSDPDTAAQASGLDVDLVRAHLEAYSAVCAGGSASGPLGKYPPSERFHWLTAPRSAVLQTSRVHPGCTDDLDTTLGRLYDQHVAPLHANG